MRVRFRFTKLGKVRFISHRDVARAWERALRRAELPVARTEGFNPRPKVHFGLALPTGAESHAEYLDVDFRDDEPVTVDVLVELLSPLLPAGIDVEAATPIETREASLQQAVTSCSWTIEARGLAPDAGPAAVAALLAAATFPVTRQRKGHDVTDDIRPYILSLEVIDALEAVTNGPGQPPLAPEGIVVAAELATQPRGLRPAELVAALAVDAHEGRICRNQQWITTDGTRREPLLAVAAPVGAP